MEHHQVITPASTSDSVRTTDDVPFSEAARARKFTQSDLPVLFRKGRKWTKTFLPTLLLWLGDQPNVWAVPEEDLIRALKEITKVVYPTFTGNLDDIGPSMPIFSVVSCFCFIDVVLTLCIGYPAPFRMAPLPCRHCYCHIELLFRREG